MAIVNEAFTAWLQSSCPVAGLPSSRAASIVVSYVGFLAVVGHVLPGQVVPGVVLPDKTRLLYKCNGFQCAVLILGLLAAAHHFSLLPLTIIHDYGGELFATTNVFVFLVSVFLYLRGVFSRSEAASFKPHLTGNVFKDWWLGVQLNPHLLGINLKFLWIRAAMIAWLLLNASLAVKQFELRGGSISPAMMLYQGFTAIYILDYLWFEEFMTTTWDIIAECFGFMLIFGDLVFIPFTFSTQAWWLLQHDVELGIAQAVASGLIFVVGYTIFRGANRQKHEFKQNPKALIWGKPPRVIGGKLLASGYWGIARHSNYLGDLLLALSFTLPCGFSSVVPYTYPIYLFVLLIIRDFRDEEKCRVKYKDMWGEYCAAVPWRIFPYVY